MMTVQKVEIIDRKSEHVVKFHRIGKRLFISTTKSMIYDGSPNNIPYCEKGDCLLTMIWQLNDRTTLTEIVNATDIIRKSIKKLVQIFDVDPSWVKFCEALDLFVVTKHAGYLTQEMKNAVARTENLKIHRIDTEEFSGHRIIQVIEKSLQTYNGYSF